MHFSNQLMHIKTIGIIFKGFCSDSKCYLITFCIMLKFFVFSFANSYCQKPLSTNLWNSLQFQGNFKKIKLTSDLGYRLCDQFTRQSRTQLVRVSIDREIGPNLSLGFGYAHFRHFSIESTTSNSSTHSDISSLENRLFVQGNRGFSSNSFFFNLRLRNEFRFFNDSKIRNRIRTQFLFQYIVNQHLKPQFSAELFYTPGKENLIEQRYIIGTNFIVKHLNFLCFYMLQIQTNVAYLQHVLGWQLQFQINN